MAVYTYSARDESGTLVQGDVTAATQSEAVRKIRGEGKYVVGVKPVGRAAPVKAQSKAKGQPAGRFGEKYKETDLIYFTNQLAVMVDTGVSLSEALEACVHEGNSPRFARALDSVIEQVRAGMEFSAALSMHPKVFSVLYVNLIKASEASGQLAPILLRLADYLQNRREMTKKIKGAITYPIVMFLFAIGVTIFMVSFVLPKFAKIYAGREDKLPTITRYLLSFSDFMAGYGLYLLIPLVAGGVGLFFYLRSEKGRIKLDKFRFSLPLIGPLFHKTFLSRSLRILGTMIQSGVSMLEGVHLTTQVCGSLFYEQMWNTVNQRVQAGQQISEALGEYPHIPQAILKMIGAGERSGRLGPIMERVAAFSEAELNVTIKTLTGMLEPAIIMFLGVIVGGLVLALLLPIFTISRALH